MVEATDGTGHVGREAVMVEVTNVDEAGTVKLSALQPAPDVPLHRYPYRYRSFDGCDSAAPSGSGPGRLRAQSGGWAVTSTRPRRASTTPDEDNAQTLVTTCGRRPSTGTKQSPSGTDNDKTASMVSANKVLALRKSNDVPEFADDQDPVETGENQDAAAEL